MMYQNFILSRNHSDLPKEAEDADSCYCQDKEAVYMFDGIQKEWITMTEYAERNGIQSIMFPDNNQIINNGTIIPCGAIITDNSTIIPCGTLISDGTVTDNGMTIGVDYGIYTETSIVKASKNEWCEPDCTDPLKTIRIKAFSEYTPKTPWLYFESLLEIQIMHKMLNKALLHFKDVSFKVELMNEDFSWRQLEVSVDDFMSL
jgi:hypothetical protein